MHQDPWLESPSSERTSKYFVLTSSWCPVYGVCKQVGKPQRPRGNFDDMYHAFITVFIIMTLDDWSDYMFPVMKHPLLFTGQPHHFTGNFFAASQ
eukprot:scaffold10425_cov22-Tisochrysis_lutea.AAC.1